MRTLAQERLLEERRTQCSQCDAKDPVPQLQKSQVYKPGMPNLPSVQGPKLQRARPLWQGAGAGQPKAAATHPGREASIPLPKLPVSTLLRLWKANAEGIETPV